MGHLIIGPLLCLNVLGYAAGYIGGYALGLPEGLSLAGAAAAVGAGSAPGIIAGGAWKFSGGLATSTPSFSVTAAGTGMAGGGT